MKQIVSATFQPALPYVIGLPAPRRKNQGGLSEF